MLPLESQSNSSVIDRTCGDEMCKFEGRYYVAAHCTNCGWKGEMRITKGHEAWRVRSQAKCPRCKCRSVATGDWLRDEPETES
jgi:hypothetical protein